MWWLSVTPNRLNDTGFTSDEPQGAAELAAAQKEKRPRRIKKARARARKDDDRT